MMVQQSDELGALFEAMAKAQTRLENAGKDAKNNHLRSEYTTLGAALDAVRPVLAEQGLCVTQWPVIDGSRVSVITRIGHASGQWMQSAISADLDKQANRVQAVGSTITYLRRYALMAVAGIAPTDDDGHAAGGRPSPRSEAWDEWQARQAGHSVDWEVGKGRFFAALGELRVKYDTLCEWLHQRGRKRPSAMSASERAKLIQWLQDGGAAKVTGGAA